MPRAPQAPFILKSGVLKSQRDSLACRLLSGSGLAVVALLGLSCASLLRPRPTELGPMCLEMMQQGVFNQASRACFPEVERPLEEFLCARTFATHLELNYLGFGYGTPVLGQTLSEARAVRALDPWAMQRWRKVHCAVPPTHSEQEAAELWERALSQLPASLVGPWQNCMSFVSPESNLRCLLHGSFDRTGQDETVQFEALYQGEDPMEFGARLTEDLIVRGADCRGEEWRAGTRLSGRRSKLLRCRRQGRSAVYFRLVTRKGECEGRLPELTEPPWEMLCRAP